MELKKQMTQINVIKMKHMVKSFLKRGNITKLIVIIRRLPLTCHTKCHLKFAWNLQMRDKWDGTTNIIYEFT